ncbi:MAG: nucleotidyl transferase AbiEii/AbiGii toxin family protein [Bilifractor sp.]|jgi:hypothetical protein
MISPISVKDRLKNQAAASGKTFQEALTAYGLERTIYRLSVSEYMERFTLKGGIFLYALFEGEFARATRDIDLLARNMQNNVEDMKKVFEDIFSIESNDALRYDLDGTELKEAAKETFEHRGTGFDDIFAFTDDFLASEIHQSRWKAFLKKKKALVNAELEEVVSLLKTLLIPIVDSIASWHTFFIRMRVGFCTGSRTRECTGMLRRAPSRMMR